MNLSKRILFLTFLLAVFLLSHPGRAVSVQQKSKSDIINFEGSVQRGQMFEKEFADNLVFRLEPDDRTGSKGEGWSMKVILKRQSAEENRTMCYEAAHGGSPCDIYAGCGSRSAADCREFNVKGLGHWWRRREFGFGMGRILPRSSEETKREDERPYPWNRFPKYEWAGTGLFTIEDVTVEKTKNEQEAKRSLYWVEQMKFNVEIKIPTLRGDK